MNNAQFRKLLETPRQAPSNNDSSTSMPPPSVRTLGSKLRSSIPMTPRSLTTSNNEFARQLAARRAAEQPVKKFRSSAAPKGSKLAAGYVDRAAALRQQEEDDDVNDEREQRLEALRQLVKDGEIEHEEYVKQTKLLGGDIASTHLVKGLDFELLRKAKAGEDLMSAITGDKESGDGDDEDLDSKLDEALTKEVSAVERKKEKKVGQKAPQSRAEILAELKRQRLAAKAATQPTLGAKFRKINDPRASEQNNSDNEGEEEEVKVKLVMGEDGKIKRKVKRKDKERERPKLSDENLGMEPPKQKPVMGIMPPPPIPGKAPSPEEEDDEDIFAGVGDYDLLAGISDSDSSDSDLEAGAERSKRPKPSSSASTSEPLPTEKTSSTSPTLVPSIKPSTLFDSTTSGEDDSTFDPVNDPSASISLTSILHRAAQINKKVESEEEKRRKKLVEAQERDSYDIDMGFGGSTNFDDDDDEAADGRGGGKRKRKRGGKKKGDKEDAGVVGRIVEERYGK
ncbi:hypothetical protein EX30DRAFT_337543 [Ascodesmis nigricans]|uniref:RED-like N-terminal domain-containing protein n=1 Tax=Ascodesmis nigricans TaxID=341454 RepID=A0A4S2N7C6_9PEZI|nr:hypothetical protein EX30DRAFT_337543 [Ascodesmis nigricans]